MALLVRFLLLLVALKLPQGNLIFKNNCIPNVDWTIFSMNSDCKPGHLFSDFFSAELAKLSPETGYI